MKNAQATFKQIFNKFVRNIDCCEGYIDDVVFYSDNWSDHICYIKGFFQMMQEAKLTINLMKSELGKATVKYFVGQGQVRPLGPKLKPLQNSLPHLTERTCYISRYGRILQKCLFELVRNCCSIYKFVKRKGKVCLGR